VDSTTTSPATVLTPEEVAALPAVALGKLAGVTHRVLWNSGTSMAGIMTVEAGRRLGLHTHHANDHHMWVLDGRAVILGTELAPGSYAHIPGGVEHDIDASTTDGCTVLYLYLGPTG
jgi:mannose-6-phosphate isomerase-like protein (cupin superfamily)